MKKSSYAVFKSGLIASSLILSACGGGGGGGGGASSGGSGIEKSPTGTSTESSTGIVPNLPPVATPDISKGVLQLPTNIADGSTVQLECGRVYQGSLNLAGKSNVSVTTSGTCGNAVITPAQAIAGWARHQGSIWVAPISFDTAQVLIDGQPAPLAHWPNRSQVWATSSSYSANSLSHAMPNADLAGAGIVFQQYDWTIEARRITGYSGNTISFATTGNLSFDERPPTGSDPLKFYVEGKLWMLDEPNEWAVHNGKLYVWTADGKTPEGRVWASPDKPGIEAANSRNIAVTNVRIYGSANGINAQGASNLRVTHSEIVNSSENGISNTGGRGLAVDNVKIQNARHDAIVVRWGGGGESITNSTIDAAGVTGMPTNSHAAIALTLSDSAVIKNNTVSNTGYIGIRAFSNSTVSGNTIYGACQVLSDCGAVYLRSDNQQRLNTRIEGNRVSKTSQTQRLSWAIQLDDAHGVTVSGNTLVDNANGMMLFNSSGNIIAGNSFKGSTQAHIQMHENRSGGVRGNVVSDNTFVSSTEENFRVSSDLGSAPIAQFSAYSGNSYSSSTSKFANYNGALINFSQWKANTGQDAGSSYTGP